MDDSDFEFVLKPGKSYWFVLNSGIWERYSKVLIGIFGPDSFFVINEEFKDDSIFVAIKIGNEPVLVSADLMGPPTIYKSGMTAESTGAFSKPEKEWQIEDYALAIHQWALAIATGPMGLISKPVEDKAKELLEVPIEGVVDAAELFLESPKKFQEAVDKGIKTAQVIVGVVVVLGLLLALKFKR